METSRDVLDSLFDQSNESITLGTLFRATTTVGSALRVEFHIPRKSGPGSRRPT
jgi:hypothetical protein